jgi:excisionase family DNA binding protein
MAHPLKRAICDDEISWGENANMRLIQAKRASEVLSVSLARLYELARLGIIPVVRLGPRQIRFDEDALTEWVKNGGLTTEENGAVQLSELTRGRSGFASAD